MHTMIIDQIMESIEIQRRILDSPLLMNGIYEISQEILHSYAGGHALLLCGNGGSAGDAQHIAGEMTARFRLERRALPALALVCNPSILTAIGNDYAYDMIFERQVEAFGRSGDTLLAISTSGNSENVYRAIIKANAMGIRTASLLGGSGGKCRDVSGISLIVPSADTPRIQECQIMIGHIICDIVEQTLFLGE